MKIIFTGDLFLGGDLLDQSCKSIIDSDRYNDVDLHIINLEQPISNNPDVADKCTLHTGSFAIEQLKQLQISAVNLAHNHIQDKNSDGIIETIQHLDSANIGHFGSGKDILEAKEPFWISDDTCVLGYCEFGRPYMKQIQVATEKEPGVNPLRYESILEDLDKLPVGAKAILYFHWGREHVWIPPHHDIDLAKKLLEDKRVALIVGMHCHRIQGYIEHKGKRAYMSLGNFLFPNFFIQPPTQIAYPTEIPNKYRTTRQYHSVNSLTYKKWRVANRTSIMLEYDTDTNRVNHIPMYQDDDIPKVKELSGISKGFVLFWLNLLSKMYTIPVGIYSILEKISTFVTYKIWRGQILLFLIRELGPVTFTRKALSYGIKKILHK